MGTTMSERGPKVSKVLENPGNRHLQMEWLQCLVGNGLYENTIIHRLFFR